MSLPTLLTWLQPLDFKYKLGICERLFGKIISSQGITWVQTGAGISWKLDLRNPTHRWIVYGKYEGAPFLNWARTFLSLDSIIVDSGANIGQMLMYLFQLIPQGKILAFEPGTEASNWLEECLAVHNTLPIELIRAGLGASPSQLNLNHVGSSLGHGAYSHISETEGEPISIVRLADELAARSITKVDLWKLDVEGYELPALQGAEPLIAEQRIKAIYAELVGDNGKQIQNYLSKFGYQCYRFAPSGKLYPSLKFSDYDNGLFLP